MPKLILATTLALLSCQSAHAIEWLRPYNSCELATLMEQEIQEQDARIEARRRCYDENPNAARAGRCTFTSNSFWLQGRSTREQQVQTLEKYRRQAQEQGLDCATLPNRIRDKR